MFVNLGIILGFFVIFKDYSTSDLNQVKCRGYVGYFWDSSIRKETKKKN